MTDSEICEAINKYKNCIYDKLNEGHFDDYFKIISKNDTNFKSIYARFYVLNGAGGLSSKQRDLYFELLEDDSETDFLVIMEKLYEVPRITKKGIKQHRYFLSFTTKLLHTKDRDIPIYDRNVAIILGLPKQEYGTKEERLQNRLRIFNELKNRVKGLLNNSCVNDFILTLRKDFSANSFWEDSLISETKILDSILWALYTCQNEDR